jgi:protein-disulfide isomerase
MSRKAVKMSRLALLLTLAGAVPAANAADADAFTPAQQAQIGQIAETYLTAHPDKMGEAVATYLADHPEFLIAASESLHQRQQIAQQQAYVQLARQYQADLLSTDSPSIGPKNAKAAVVMFFDYQCAWCSKMAPVVEQVIKSNPDIRFVFKEFPIFASRWPASGLAARIGEQIWLNKGGEAYLAWHNALYATGKVEGDLTEPEILTSAERYLTAEQIAAVKQMHDSGPVHDALMVNRALAQHMGFTGTPAFVVMPQAKEADIKQITVIPGSTSQDMLLMAIQKAKG